MRTLLLASALLGLMVPAPAWAQYPSGPEDCRSTEIWNPSTRRCTVRNTYIRPNEFRLRRPPPVIIERAPSVKKTPPRPLPSTPGAKDPRLYRIPQR